VRDRGERQRYREIERHRNKETELTIIPSKAQLVQDYWLKFQQNISR
jgi:hypothetical protein